MTIDNKLVERIATFGEEDIKYRADEVNDGGYRDEVISNAPKSEDGFFLVPKVVD